MVLMIVARAIDATNSLLQDQPQPSRPSPRRFTNGLVTLTTGESETQPNIATSGRPRRRQNPLTFKLREGVYLTNGKPFTSADVPILRHGDFEEIPPLARSCSRRG